MTAIPTDIGTIIVRMGLASPEQVSGARHRQATSSNRKLIGEILVEDGVLTADQVAQALVIQASLRSIVTQERAAAMIELVKLGAECWRASSGRVSAKLAG